MVFFPVQRVEFVDEKIIVIRYTDARALSSHLLRDAGQVANKQLRVVIANLRELLAMPGIICRWVDTAVQLADCTTKGEIERGYLRAVMASGFVTTIPDEKALDSKAMIRAGRHRRAEFKRDLKNEIAVE